jgi:hypothetical protein
MKTPFSLNGRPCSLFNDDKLTGNPRSLLQLNARCQHFSGLQSINNNPTTHPARSSPSKRSWMTWRQLMVGWGVARHPGRWPTSGRRDSNGETFGRDANSALNRRRVNFYEAGSGQEENRPCLVLSLLLFVAAAWAVRASQQSAAQTGRTPQFENDEVRVWKSIILPNSSLPLHRHDYPRVITPLVSGTMKIVGQDGSSETHVWETDKSYWLPANAPGTLHTDVNAGDKPIEVMVVELKKAH